MEVIIYLVISDIKSDLTQLKVINDKDRWEGDVLIWFSILRKSCSRWIVSEMH